MLNVINDVKLKEPLWSKKYHGIEKETLRHRSPITSPISSEGNLSCQTQSTQTVVIFKSRLRFSIEIILISNVCQQSRRESLRDRDKSSWLIIYNKLFTLAYHTTATKIASMLTKSLEGNKIWALKDLAQLKDDKIWITYLKNNYDLFV